MTEDEDEGEDARSDDYESSVTESETDGRWSQSIRKTITEEEFIKKKESEYIHKVQEKKEHAGDIVWF